MGAVGCAAQRGVRALAAFVVAAGVAVQDGSAQQRPTGAAGVLVGQWTESGMLAPAPAPPRLGMLPPLAPPWSEPSGELGEGKAFLYSLVVPGLSQYRQGNRRWLLYAGTELLSAFLYLDARSDARGHRAAYRDFAWTRARMGVSSQPRRDGDFEYYETLSKWTASGAWDSDPAREGLQPESDPGTFNGWVWGLAREIFNVDATEPEGSAGYGRALDFYRDRGYGLPHLWLWRAGGAEQDDFRAMITASDRRAVDARRALWIVGANHLFSAIDGFITARIAAMPPSGALGLVITVPVP